WLQADGELPAQVTGFDGRGKLAGDLAAAGVLRVGSHDRPVEQPADSKIGRRANPGADGTRHVADGNIERGRRLECLAINGLGAFECGPDPEDVTEGIQAAESGHRVSILELALGPHHEAAAQLTYGRVLRRHLRKLVKKPSSLGELAQLERLADP